MRRGASHIAVLALLAGCARGGAPTAQEPAADPTTGSIAGTVMDAASGDPLSLADIEATEWSSKERKVAQATTAANGTYQITGLPSGTYLVDVKYADHRLRFFAVPVKAGASTSLDANIDTGQLSSDRSYEYVDIAKNPVIHAAAPDPNRVAGTSTITGGIRGLVRDLASDEELPGAVVAATTPGARDAKLAIADDDGTYLLRSLAPGTYTLSVYYHLVERGNIEVRRTGVEVVAGEITEINLDLDAKTDE